VGKVAKKMGIEVVSLDNMSVSGLPKPDIEADIRTWDYKKLPSDQFDIIWASPVCTYFSSMRMCNIGREVNGETLTREKFEQDIKDKGLPLLDKVLEIIAYFKPQKCFIENPETGLMKKYLAGPHSVVSYSAYGMVWDKPTRIYNNLQKFKPKVPEDKAGAEGSAALLAANKRDRAVIPEKLIDHLLKTMVAEWHITAPVQLTRMNPAPGKLFESEPVGKRGAGPVEEKQPAPKKPRDAAFDAWVGRPTSLTGRAWLESMIATFGLMTVAEYDQ